MAKKAIPQMAVVAKALQTLTEALQPVVAAREAPATQRGPKRGPKARAEETTGETDWTAIFKRCPMCGKRKPVLSVPSDGEERAPDFGVRKVRGISGPQSYCRACRSGLSYYKADRKYRSRNNPA